MVENVGAGGTAVLAGADTPLSLPSTSRLLLPSLPPAWPRRRCRLVVLPPGMLLASSPRAVPSFQLPHWVRRRRVPSQPSPPGVAASLPEDHHFHHPKTSFHWRTCRSCFGLSLPPHSVEFGGPPCLEASCVGPRPQGHEQLRPLPRESCRLRGLVADVAAVLHGGRDVLNVLPHRCLRLSCMCFSHMRRSSRP